jgi:hypothetical protein
VDVGTQGTTPEDANIHAMLGTTDGKGNEQLQSVADAAAKIQLITSTAPEYRAAHTAQDRAAPHHYLKPWYGYQTIGHLWHDAFPSASEVRDAAQATQEVLAGPKGCKRE